MSQSPETLLTLREVAERLNVPYERLRVYADAEGVKEFVGAQDMPRSKGKGYPESSVAIFAQIMEDAAAKRITPKTIVHHLPTLAIVRSSQSHSQAIVPLELSDARQLIGALFQLVSNLPPADDELLTVHQVAALLKCAPSTVRKRVKPVLRGRWRRSDILRWIAALGE
jgi:hypothetical protein